jgi:hypothetical protein
MITVTAAETAVECVYGEDCPLHTENPPFNAVTLAAMQEAKDIAGGKIPGKWYHSLEEARKDLGV